MFKIYDCDFGITVDGVNYDFDHVDNLSIENPERTRLIRGANASNDIGLDYKEGIRDAKIVTVTVLGVSAEMHGLLTRIYKERTRVDAYCVSRTDGSSKIAKNAVLSQEPTQMNMSESSDSLNIDLVFESFNIEEKRKS